MVSCDSGTPALTSRGFAEEDFEKVADFFDAAAQLALKIKAETKGIFLRFISHIYRNVFICCKKVGVDFSHLKYMLTVFPLHYN